MTRLQPSKERYPSIDLLPVGRPIGPCGCNDDLLVQEACALGLRSSLSVGQIFELALRSVCRCNPPISFCALKAFTRINSLSFEKKKKRLVDAKGEQK